LQNLEGNARSQQPKPLPLSPRLVPIQGDTQEKWFFYDPLAWTAWLSTLLENKPPGTEYRNLPTVPTQGKPVIHRANTLIPEGKSGSRARKR